MTLSAAALNLPALNLSTLLPLAVVAGGVYLLHRHQGMNLGHAIACLVLGVVLAGTSVGPQISSLLSQVSGGHL